MPPSGKIERELEPDPGTFYRCKCGVGAYGTDIATHLATHNRLSLPSVDDWVSPEQLD